MKTQLTALGADIFAGLFTVGVKQAGFKVLGHLEHGDYGVATAKLNHPGLDVRIGPHAWKPQDFTGGVDFMFTNSPCAAWSSMKMGHKGVKNYRDPSEAHRLQYVRDCVGAGLIVKPKAWAWESVTNAWRHGQDFVLEMAEMWTGAGYHVTVLLQDNQYLGVPQVRRRMFLIAHKHPLVWPKLTAAPTVREVLKVTKKLKAAPDQPQMPEKIFRNYERLWDLAEHHKGRMRHAMVELENGPDGYDGCRPMAITRRLEPDVPAPVMLASIHRFHPFEPRMLRWPEWLAFCGMPPNWRSGAKNYDEATRELARAVMPPVGRWLATAVKQGLKLPPLAGAPTARLVDLRDPENPIEELLYKRDRGPNAKPPVWDPPPPEPLKPKRAGASVKAPRDPNLPPRKPGSGVRIRELLVKGWDAERILATIHKEFPGSKATKSDVSWNKGRLRKEGVEL